MFRMMNREPTPSKHDADGLWTFDVGHGVHSRSFGKRPGDVGNVSSDSNGSNSNDQNHKSRLVPGPLRIRPSQTIGSDCPLWSSSDFKIIKTLGHGHFGTVYHATAITTRDTLGNKTNVNNRSRKYRHQHDCYYRKTNQGVHDDAVIVVKESKKAEEKQYAIKKFSKSRVLSTPQERECPNTSRLYHLLADEINIHSKYVYYTVFAHCLSDVPQLPPPHSLPTHTKRPNQNPYICSFLIVFPMSTLFRCSDITTTCPISTLF